MNDIEKIIQIFESGEYKLALELTESIGLTHLELLQYIWNNYKKGYSEVINELDICDFGEYTVRNIISIVPFYPYQLHKGYHNIQSCNTLEHVFKCMLDDINRVN